MVIGTHTLHDHRVVRCEARRSRHRQRAAARAPQLARRAAWRRQRRIRFQACVTKKKPRISSGAPCAAKSLLLLHRLERHGLVVQRAQIVGLARAIATIRDVATELAELPHLILICGRYEGVDERVSEHLCDRELSIGDYVLAGGEVAALVVVEAVARLVPGVMGNQASAGEERLPVRIECAGDEAPCDAKGGARRRPGLPRLFPGRSGGAVAADADGPVRRGREGRGCPEGPDTAGIAVVGEDPRRLARALDGRQAGAALLRPVRLVA